MTDILKLGSLDLLDNTKFERVELDDSGPNINRETRSGCGTAMPRLVKRQLVEWPLPLTVYCLTPDGVMTNRDLLIAELEKTWNLNLPTVYLERNVGSQSPSDWWTIFDYQPSFQKKASNKRFVTIGVTLKAFPGQQLPEGL